MCGVGRGGAGRSRGGRGGAGRGNAGRFVLQRKLKQDWEVRPHAIGIMVLNSDVNLPLLNAHFSLLPFYGLRQPHTRDILNLAGWVKPRPEMAQAMGTQTDTCVTSC